MIDRVDAGPAPAAVWERAGGALLARFGSEPASGSRQEWVDWVTSRLPAAAACAVVEHLFGVLPLLDAFFEPLPGLAEIAGGRRLAALGLFTPAPEPGWSTAAVEGEPAGSGWRLHGEVRIPLAAADDSLVLVRLAGGEQRLACLDHGAPGVERSGSRSGGACRTEGPCWLVLAGAAVGSERMSRPVTLAKGGELRRCLADYAGVWALAAALCARGGVRWLRRAARTNRHRGTAWSASQLVALGITEVEIEAELAVAAARQQLAADTDADGGAGAGTGGLLVAVAAARALAAVGAKAAELRERMGLAIDRPVAGAAGGGEGAGGTGAAEGPGMAAAAGVAGESAAALTAFLGGAPMLESELGGALGIPGGAAAEATE